jgi:heat shock protein HslJ
MNLRGLGLGAMLLVAAGCVSSTAVGREDTLVRTAWTAVGIDDVATGDRAPTLTFDSERRVSGRASCNQYSGTLQLGAGTLRVAEPLSTRMACEPVLMTQERRFLTALQEVRTYRRDGDHLLLLDEAGRVRLRLAPRR